MADEQLLESLTHLLGSRGRAHLRVFAATEGVHPEWPLQNATHLRDELNILLGAELTVSETAHLTLVAGHRMRADAAEEYWADAYSGFMIRHQEDDLA
jgi:hypothetical protein